MVGPASSGRSRKSPLHPRAVTGDVESVGWNVGASVSASGFNMTGSYYDGEALGTLLFNSGGGLGFGCDGSTCSEADNDGFLRPG